MQASRLHHECSANRGETKSLVSTMLLLSCSGLSRAFDADPLRVGQALVNVWFASLTGWASGLHGVEAIIADTHSAAELILDGSARLARRASDGDPGLPPQTEHV